MKMKKTCEVTALTERAIRLYLRKNLVSPRHIDGIIDFSNDDIQQLKDIAILRKFDFSIEQISSMLHDSTTISDIVRFRIDNAQTAMEHENDVCTILSNLEVNTVNSINALASQIRGHRMVPQEPNFGKFDELSEELLQRENMDVFKKLSRLDKKKQLTKRIISITCFFTVFAVFAVIFLSYPRLSGYISIAPLSIVKINENNTITVCVNDEAAVDIIGRNTITVRYQAYGVNIESGNIFETSCQLAIELTNFDLVKMGINPLQNFQTKSADINEEWIKSIMHSLFEISSRKKVTLWIDEPCNLRPLLRWRQ